MPYGILYLFFGSRRKIEIAKIGMENRTVERKDILNEIKRNQKLVTHYFPTK